MSTQASFGHTHKIGLAASSNATGSISSTRLRSNLLNKLGIHAVDKLPVSSSRPTRSLLDGAPRRSEPLKYDENEEDISDDDDERQDRSWGRPWTVFRPASYSSAGPLSSSVSSTTSFSSSSQQPQHRITFNDNVTVVPIPKRDDYSHRVKERLWSNINEIQLNAQRNALEFAAEGWDWRTVAEDEEMYRCADSGEKIHPVHLEESH